jgi:hypothetical protein
MVNHALMSSNIHFINLLRFELTLTFRQVGLKLVIDFSIDSRPFHLKLSLLVSWVNGNFIYFKDLKGQGHLLNPPSSKPSLLAPMWVVSYVKQRVKPDSTLQIHNPIHYRDHPTMIWAWAPTRGAPPLEGSPRRAC